MFAKTVTALGALVLLTTTLPVHAQNACGPREQMIGALGEKYEERLVAGGLTGPTRLLEVWTTADGGTWTILLTEASGRSCIIAAGEDWVDFPDTMARMMQEYDS